MGAAGYIINNRLGYKPYIEKDTERVLDDFEGAVTFHKTVEYYEPTPIKELPVLSEQVGIGKILIKDEGARFGTSAIKILGASYAIEKVLSSGKPFKGICTATDGNHGRAIAWVSKRKKIEAVVFVPQHTVESRIKYIKNEGAEVVVCNGEYDAAVKEAFEYSRRNNFALLQDTAWKGYVEIPATITAGYYTQMHELYDQTNNLNNPKIDVIFIQAGVGSWPSAIVHFLRRYKKNEKIKVVCVEPYESDAIYESIKRSALASTRKSQQTIMAGLNCGTPSSLAFEILKNGTDAFSIISDQYAIDAIKYLNAPLPGDQYIAAGESGAAGLAGLLAIMNSHSMLPLRNFLGLNAKSNVLIFNTETVTDPILFSELMNSGRKPE